MSDSRSHFYSALTGGLVVAVVMAMLPATAATGDVAKMGQWNRAGTQTVFTAAAGTTLQVRNTRTTGIPLRLIGDASMPPMQVSSDVLVANLNADLLDGMGASAFAADGHPHAWADLTSGIPADLADGDDDTVYTDPEAVAAVLAADGTESGLDADLLDGHDTGYFAIDGHGHTVTDLSDVTLTSIGVGELLRWTGTAWVNATLSEAGIAAAIHN
ncbi:MAG: hypothetical protein KJ698_07410, partial [Actinobacteria bacterium]|nr:hypothetical protein [Actinomycetota bacterium]